MLLCNVVQWTLYVVHGCWVIFCNTWVRMNPTKSDLNCTLHILLTWSYESWNCWICALSRWVFPTARFFFHAAFGPPFLTFFPGFMAMATPKSSLGPRGKGRNHPALNLLLLVSLVSTWNWFILIHQRHQNITIAYRTKIEVIYNTLSPQLKKEKIGTEMLLF